MKMNRCRYLFVCIISLSVLFLRAAELCPKRHAAGEMLETSGTPSQNAKVVIVNVINQKAKEKEKKSDAQGVAEFAKLEDGVYRVFARKEGFAPALYEFALLKGSSESVTLNLVAGADKKLYFEDPAEEQRANQFLRQGLETAKQNKYEEAEKLFNQALEIKPSSVETLYFYGAASITADKFDRAVELLTQAAKISDALKTLPSAVAANPNPYETVLRNANQVLKQMPTYRGESALRQKNWIWLSRSLPTRLKTARTIR